MLPYWTVFTHHGKHSFLKHKPEKSGNITNQAIKSQMEMEETHYGDVDTHLHFPEYVG
jgi:hypothetical protein